MIDWGPAMQRSCSDSIESGYSNILSSSVVAMDKSASEIAQLKIPFKNSSFPSFGATDISRNHNMPSPSLSNSNDAGGHFFAQFDRINYGNTFLEFPLEKKHEMTDKTTQAKMSCEKCARLWSIIERRKSKGLISEGPLSKR
uniref:HMG box domain-containing protein n=1 Tax=Meloidogyne hapla TaxID=6305 RepID=A0A1I8B753_MELHA